MQASTAPQGKSPASADVCTTHWTGPPAAPSCGLHYGYLDWHKHRVVTLTAPGYTLRAQTPHITDSVSSPGVWYGSETHTDAKGRSWTSALQHQMVMDDFGFLVQVPA